MDRRSFIIAGIVSLAFSSPSPAQTAPADGAGPEAIVKWIYTQAAKGKKGDQAGGGFLFDEDKKLMPKVFSPAFLRDWNLAQARIKKSGDVGLDFDPVSNSQEPSIAGWRVRLLSNKADKARVAATFHRQGDPPDNTITIRYDFVRTGSAWKIDDINGSVDGEDWSLRKLMTKW